MKAVHITLKVKREHVEAFIEASRVNAAGTATESGCLRFDLFQSPDDQTSFTLFEVYVSPEAQQAHFASDHFRVWREATGDMIENTDVSSLIPVFVKGTGS